MAPRRFNSRKLLVASVGVATVNYVAACDAFAGRGDRTETSGNLVAPPSMQHDDFPPTVGNLVGPPPPPFDAGLPPTSGNLVSPPVIDAGPPPPLPEVDAGDEVDAGVEVD